MNYLYHYWKGMGSHWPSCIMLMYITPMGQWGMMSHKYPTICQCCIHNINNKHLLNGALNLKQTTQYKKYCIWNIKLVVQIKFSMALLETYQTQIIFKSWYCIKKPISLRYIVLWDGDFQLRSIQTPLSTFA
jgi:hypothetical protein